MDAAALDFNHRPEPPTLGDVGQRPDRRGPDAPERRPAAARLSRRLAPGRRLRPPAAVRVPERRRPTRGASFSGQTLRIFAVGHVFEDLAVDWLRQAGFDLRTRNRAGEQFGFSVAGGRVQGHIDGVIVAAPMAMAVPALWECKSANARNWQEIARRGVVAAKPIYAAQIALYQAYMGLTDAPALFTAVNKDTSELWHETVPFDAALAQAASDKAVRILRACDAGELLPRLAVRSGPLRVRALRLAASGAGHDGRARAPAGRRPTRR